MIVHSPIQEAFFKASREAWCTDAQEVVTSWWEVLLSLADRLYLQHVGTTETKEEDEIKDEDKGKKINVYRQHVEYVRNTKVVDVLSEEVVETVYGPSLPIRLNNDDNYNGVDSILPVESTVAKVATAAASSSSLEGHVGSETKGTSGTMRLKLSAPVKDTTTTASTTATTAIATSTSTSAVLSEQKMGEEQEDSQPLRLKLSLGSGSGAGVTSTVASTTLSSGSNSGSSSSSSSSSDGGFRIEVPILGGSGSSSSGGGGGGGGLSLRAQAALSQQQQRPYNVGSNTTTVGGGSSSAGSSSSSSAGGGASSKRGSGKGGSGPSLILNLTTATIRPTSKTAPRRKAIRGGGEAHSRDEDDMEDDDEAPLMRTTAHSTACDIDSSNIQTKRTRGNRLSAAFLRHAEDVDVDEDPVNGRGEEEDEEDMFMFDDVGGDPRGEEEYVEEKVRGRAVVDDDDDDDLPDGDSDSDGSYVREDAYGDTVSRSKKRPKKAGGGGAQKKQKTTSSSSLASSAGLSKPKGKGTSQVSSRQQLMARFNMKR